VLDEMGANNDIDLSFHIADGAEFESSLFHVVSFKDGHDAANWAWSKAVEVDHAIQNNSDNFFKSFGSGYWVTVGATHFNDEVTRATADLPRDALSSLWSRVQQMWIGEERVARVRLTAEALLWYQLQAAETPFERRRALKAWTLAAIRALYRVAETHALFKAVQRGVQRRASLQLALTNSRGRGENPATRQLEFSIRRHGPPPAVARGPRLGGGVSLSVNATTGTTMYFLAHAPLNWVASAGGVGCGRRIRSDLCGLRAICGDARSPRQISCEGVVRASYPERARPVKGGISQHLRITQVRPSDLGKGLAGPRSSPYVRAAPFESRYAGAATTNARPKARQHLLRGSRLPQDIAKDFSGRHRRGGRRNRRVASRGTRP
jgi:hypothetical protein